MLVLVLLDIRNANRRAIYKMSMEIQQLRLAYWVY